MSGKHVAAGVAVAVCLAVPILGQDRLPTALPALSFEPREKSREFEMPRERAEELRRDALMRAGLWLRPDTPIALADLGRTSAGSGALAADELVCKFHPRRSSGSTPKFDCVFAGGEILKVKYGRNAEVHTEVAASRLLRALGAGADRMYLVKRLRCFGCPEDPRMLLDCISSPFEEVRRDCQPRYGTTGPGGEFTLQVDYSSYVDFEPVAIERRAEGEVIETGSVEGWGWDELDRQQSARGPGAQRERDALRLLAVLLNNWDNRRDNQRLLCLPGGRIGDGRCRRPFAYMHDLGATFGHAGGESKQQRKLDVEGWRAAAIWKDPARCLVSIESPPLHGASFGEAVISEAGRSFLARRLRELRPQQLRELFAGAAFGEYDAGSPANRDIGAWVSAFQHRVRQITERAPCPTP